MLSFLDRPSLPSTDLLEYPLLFLATFALLRMIWSESEEETIDTASSSSSPLLFFSSFAYNSLEGCTLTALFAVKVSVVGSFKSSFSS